jgi:hypothetical protein
MNKANTEDKRDQEKEVGIKHNTEDRMEQDREDRKEQDIDKK